MSFMASPRKIPKQSRFFSSSYSFVFLSLFLVCSPSHSCCHSFSHPFHFTHFCCFQYTTPYNDRKFFFFFFFYFHFSLLFYFVFFFVLLEAMLTILSDFLVVCTCEEDAWKLWHTNLFIQTHTLHIIQFFLSPSFPPTNVALLSFSHFIFSYFPSHITPLMMYFHVC